MAGRKLIEDAIEFGSMLLRPKATPASRAAGAAVAPAVFGALDGGGS